MLLASDGDGHDDDDGDNAVALDVRALVEGAESRGAFIEVVRCHGARVIEHVVLPPAGSARFGAVLVRGLGAGGALVGDLLICEGERLTVPLDDGELWVRFAPAPRRLLPAEASRLAVVLLVIVACVASLAGVAARGGDAASALGGGPVAGAFERTHGRAARRARRRALAMRLRMRRRRVTRARRPRAARAQRPVRRGVPRRSAPDPDGGDGSDDDDERRGRAPQARARGPPR